MVVGLIPVQQTANSNNYLLNFQNVQNCAGYGVPQLQAPSTLPSFPFGMDFLQQGNHVNPFMMVPMQVPQQVQQVPVPMQVPPAFVVNSTLAPSPPLQPASLSPEFTFFRNSPSPSPCFAPVQNMNDQVMENFDLGASIQSQNMQLENEPAFEPVQNVQVDPQCETFFELPIIKHQATVKSISEKHGGELADAMRIVLNQNIRYLFVRVVQNDKAMAIQWCAHPSFCDLQGIRVQTQAKDFKNKLICRLARLGGGEFNRHLHGSKQLTIVNEGYRLVDRLGRALMSFNHFLDDVLSVPEEDQFDDVNTRKLFRVCEAEKGKALRGYNVVGAHFRGVDVLKMVDFVELVESVTGHISRATMIPSMKGKAQYKGWSIYIETRDAQQVQEIINTCQGCNFDKVDFFQAVDKHQQ